MLSLSIVSLALLLLGMFPFTIPFAVAFVGIPTLVLLVGWKAGRDSKETR